MKAVVGYLKNKPRLKTQKACCESKTGYEGGEFVIKSPRKRLKTQKACCESKTGYEGGKFVIKSPSKCLKTQKACPTIGAGSYMPESAEKLEINRE